VNGNFRDEKIDDYTNYVTFENYQAYKDRIYEFSKNGKACA